MKLPATASELAADGDHNAVVVVIQRTIVGNTTLVRISQPRVDVAVEIITCADIEQIEVVFAAEHVVVEIIPGDAGIEEQVVGGFPAGAKLRAGGYGGARIYAVVDERVRFGHAARQGAF